LGKIKQLYILIFGKISIKNRYLGVFRYLRKHKQNMIFHVVAIRELFWKNYSIDVLFFWLSEERVRDVLREYKLVALEIYEYKKEKVENYWKLKILIEFEWQDIRLLSNATDLEGIAYWLSVLWFNIKNINNVGNDQIEQAEIDKILNKAKSDAKEWLTEQENIIAQKEKKEEELLDEKKWEKYRLEIDKLLKNIEKLVNDAKNDVPKEKLNKLFKQWQELSKLKMWRNLEKIASFLEATYNIYSDTEQEYLAKKQASRINVSWSDISDTYVISEIQKLEKAKWLTNVWSTNISDVLNANFWVFSMYFKFIKRDFINKIKNFSQDFPKIFDDILIGLFFLTVFSALYFLWGKISYSQNTNDYVYVMLIHFWVFWLVLYIANFIKKRWLVFNIVLLISWVVISLVLMRVLKQNFIF